MYLEGLVDAADDVAVSVKPALELNPNSTDEEKLRQSSARAYSFCSDFDLSGRWVRLMQDQISLLAFFRCP